ncbi:aspartate aminotransferase family protein [Conexibacter woesei]|uniref:Aminotransferase class-III n=1 Tax=Conexibacter woesei (strain DSM 14684 / CCUG 47730 / CIP 108061 / JCM 11494 / NBRC 100937 / ID131577) TaxID=469383 RepID=D3FEK1_CONWI|nr:aspartate aminotransferase family protein [Conexibacter woesei]ADB49675.1 aminotransferase class-III [Conexibacter woesei DSM 14684]
MTTQDSRAAADLRARALRVLPGGVNSNVRLDAPPVFFARGEGAWLWDVDGNDYVDHLLGQGPAFLGHAHPEVVARVAEACGTGMVFGAQHPLEVEAAELVRELVGWAEMVRLGMTGTETVQAAFRLARAVTGRTKIVRFEGQYHGWLDNVLIRFEPGPAQVATAGQPPSALADTIVLPWNDLGAVRAALELHGDDVAAIVTEPMMLNQGAIEPAPGFLAGLKELAADAGALLIFDEVITGFRLALGGAAERYGVTPDLAVYGKALAGGFPVAALAGSAELMERFGTAEVNHSGTFNACVMAAAAVVASLEALRDDPPYARVRAHGVALMDGLREAAAEAGVPLRLQGPGIAFHASFAPEGSTPDEIDVRDLRGLRTLDAARYQRFARALADAGVWVAGRGVWYVSAAHGERELDAALTRAAVALRGA